MARAIVRLSIDGPSPNNQMQTFKKRMAPLFVASDRTGTIESYGDRKVLLGGLRDMLAYLEDELPPEFGVDHIWIYVDKAEPHV